MRQPKWDDPIESMREFLKFAVPLAAAADPLAKRAELPADELGLWEPRMRALIGRGGEALVGYGDQLTHTARYPAQRKLARTAAGELAYGIAAAALLRIHELRQRSDWELEQIRATPPGHLQQGADTARFGGGAPGEAARSIGAWTTVLALLALLAEGGADFQGMHWCAVSGCPTTAWFDHVDDIRIRWGQP